MEEIQIIKDKLDEFEEERQERLPFLLKLASLLYEIVPDESLALLDEAERIAVNFDDLDSLADVYSLYGKVYIRKSLYAEAEKMLEQALELSKSNNRSFRSDVLISLSALYYETARYDKSLDVINYVIELNKGEDNLKLGNAYINKGTILSKTADYDAIIQNFNMAIEAFESENDKRGLAFCNLSKGRVSFYKTNIAEAMEYFFKALEYSEPLGNKYLESMILNNIGDLYRVVGCLEDALRYFDRSLDLKRTIGNRAGTITTLVNQALVHLELKNIEKVFEKLGEARLLLDETEIPSKKFDLLFSEGLAFKEIKNYDKANSIFVESYNYAQQYNLRRRSNNALIQIGLTYFFLEDFDNALDHLKKGIIEYKASQTHEHLRDAYSILAKLAYGNKDFEEAYQYKELELKELDRIKSKEFRDRIAGAQIMYNIVERDKKILYLKKEKAILQQSNEKILTQYQNELSEAIINSQESLKTHLSTELHTNIGLELVVLKNLLEGEETQKVDFKLLIKKIKEIHSRIRTISNKVVTEQSNEVDIINSLEKLIKGLNEKNKSLKINLYPFNMFHPITLLKAFSIHSFIRECISNCLQHANASILDIHMTRHEDVLNVIVEDNGEGFNMKENGDKFIAYINLAKQIDARFNIDSTIGKGTTIILDVPL